MIRKEKIAFAVGVVLLIVGIILVLLGVKTDSIFEIFGGSISAVVGFLMCVGSGLVWYAQNEIGDYNPT